MTTVHHFSTALAERQLLRKLAEERAAQEIEETLLDGREIRIGFERFMRVGQTDLLERLDVDALLAAVKHGTTGSHAQAVGIFTKAITEAARRTGEHFAVSRASYLEQLAERERPEQWGA